MSRFLRRDFLKGMVAIPFLGYFGYAFKENINKELSKKAVKDYRKVLRIDQLEAPMEKLLPPTGNSGNRLRFGLVGNGWRGEQLLKSLGFVHPEFIKQNIADGKYSQKLEEFTGQEDLNVEFAGICDTFKVHTQRGIDISLNDFNSTGKTRNSKQAKVFESYRDMIASDEIDAIIIATPDHMHARIAIEAAKAGKHVYLEKPMAHTIEEAIELRNTIKSTGVIFQLGHQNRQQMSFKVARELFLKGVLGDVSLVQTYTNRNGLFDAWIRDNAFDHQLGNNDNINWEEFLGKAPWHEFDLKRYFSWQRYSEYGTNVTGNDFTHKFDYVNQVLDLGIPESVVALGGQHYYKDHGDMADVLNAVLHYPKRNLTLTYDCTLKNGNYRPPRIYGNEAYMDIDGSIAIYKEGHSERYKNVETDNSDPLYYYAPSSNVDAVSSATSKAYLKGGFGPTYIDGKVIDATLLHLKEWVDAIRTNGKTSCNIDIGFEESITFNLINQAFIHQKKVKWDSVNHKILIG